MRLSKFNSLSHLTLEKRTEFLAFERVFITSVTLLSS